MSAKQQNPSCLTVVGMQWGDEGKGKIVDHLAARADAVVRFQGGHNAGHTLVIDGQQMILHALPTGMARAGIRNYIGNGAVLSLPDMIQELKDLETHHKDVRQRLFISHKCSLILSIHKVLDETRELCAHQDAIGTTGKGIGPAYEDKAARRGIRLDQLLYDSGAKERMRALYEFHNFILQHYYKRHPCDFEREWALHYELALGLKDQVIDLEQALRQHSEKGHSIIFEGAQGLGLDIDHGTFPWVTSSHTHAGYAAVGSGMSLSAMGQIIGVSKAYTTRVGNGPFPTELSNSEGEHLGRVGNEFGATTGRKRRCGWLDLPELRRNVQLCGVTALVLTKLDVLTGLANIGLCVGYRFQGKRYPSRPMLAQNEALKPDLSYLPGWDEPIEAITDFEALPKRCQTLVKTIEDFVGVPVKMISNGPERCALIQKENIW